MRVFVQVKTRGDRANECIILKHTQTPELPLRIQPLSDTHTYAFVPGSSFCMSQLCESGYER